MIFILKMAAITIITLNYQRDTLEEIAEKMPSLLFK